MNPIQNNTTRGLSYANGASGYRINTAADDAAGLAIAEKDNAQVKGYDQGANNIASGRDLLNVADGGLEDIADYLGRIKELSIQASNATVTDSDRQKMQAEVGQLLQGINDTANNTSYNTKPLLNGENTEFNIATDGNGNSTTVNTPNSLLSELGIEGYDLTQNFNMSAIDDALERVNSARSEIGAKSSALDYAYNSATNSSLQHSASLSQKKDLDMAEYVSEQKKKETIDQYQTFMTKKRMEQEVSSNERLLNGLS